MKWLAKLLHSNYILSGLFFSILTISPLSLAISQDQSKASSTSDLGHIIGIFNIWVTILGIMVTLLLAFAAINLLTQTQQAKKLGESLLKKVDLELSDLKEKYHLNSIEPPSQILNMAKNDYLPLITNLRDAVDGKYTEINQFINKMNADFKAYDEIQSQRYLELRTLTAELTAKISHLKEINARYTPSSHLQEQLLRKVLEAFLKVRTLKKDELDAISTVLKAGSETKDRGDGDNSIV